MNTKSFNDRLTLYLSLYTAFIVAANIRAGLVINTFISTGLYNLMIKRIRLGGIWIELDKGLEVD